MKIQQKTDITHFVKGFDMHKVIVRQKNNN
jgi:hypothetical protein